MTIEENKDGMNVLVLPVTPFQQNCALIYDGKTRLTTIVDPGGDADLIFKQIKDLELKPEQILLTHGHIDHVGGVADLIDLVLDDEEAGIDRLPILGPHPDDLFLMQGVEKQAKEFGLQGVRNCKPDFWLDEGKLVSIAGVTFSILHCPGHTPGHLVYLQSELKFAIMGDVLFQGSIGRTDFPYGDTQALLNSIREKILPLEDDIGFLCGHGPASSIGQERRTNPFLQGFR